VANEITLSASFEYDKDDAEFEQVISSLSATVSGDNFVRHKQLIGTTEEALDIGSLTTLGWCIIRNLDDENYVEIRSATGAGNDVIKIPALKFALFHFGSDVTAPFAIANTADCLIDYFISEP
jgi:hypothetical protein